MYHRFKHYEPTPSQSTHQGLSNGIKSVVGGIREILTWQTNKQSVKYMKAMPWFLHASISITNAKVYYENIILKLGKWNRAQRWSHTLNAMSTNSWYV